MTATGTGQPAGGPAGSAGSASAAGPAGSGGSAASHEFAVVSTVERFAGPMFRVVTDDVVMPGGAVAARDYMQHIGAVGVVAIDEADRVVLVQQYRHPVGRRLYELPAGLIDVAGEALVDAAARELAEEADLTAGQWDLLVDMHPSPGCSNELIRLYLARDLSPVPADERHARTEEEAELSSVRIDLDEAVGMAMRGEILNGACLVGVLAAAAVRANGWQALRDPGTPVPQYRRPVAG